MLGYVFLAFFYSFWARSRKKWLKLGLFAMKLGTQNYLVYVIVLNLLESKTILIWLKLRAKLRCKVFLSVFGTFLQKVVETWFVCNETWHIILFGISYCVEKDRIENNSHMLDITC